MGGDLLNLQGQTTDNVAPIPQKRYYKTNFFGSGEKEDR
jgi:hypothetical protein